MKKIVCLSDTHNKHKKILVPECDYLFHTGDFSSMGRPHEVEEFVKWFSVQPAAHKVFISGNHDFLDEKDPKRFKEILDQYPNVTYLRDEGITLDGLKIWGRPTTPTFYDWAFMADRGSPKMKSTLSIIPSDIDVLLTHGPAFGILDSVRGDHVGCDDLLMELERLTSLKLMVFGHIHDSSGMREVNNVLHVNAAILDDYYQIAYPPKVLNYDGTKFIPE